MSEETEGTSATLGDITIAYTGSTHLTQEEEKVVLSWIDHNRTALKEKLRYVRRSKYRDSLQCHISLTETTDHSISGAKTRKVWCVLDGFRGETHLQLQEEENHGSDQGRVIREIATVKWT